MANENNTSFELDAGKLLATLHLAAAAAVPNSVSLNTGIVNPAAKPDPANPGKTEFNLDGDEYQIGISNFTTPLTYSCQIDLTKDKKLAKAYEEFKKAEEKDNKQKNESVKLMSFSEFLLLEDNKEAGSDKGILDKDKDAQDKDNKGDKEKNNEQQTNNMLIKDTESYKKALELIEIYNDYIKNCKAEKFKQLAKLINDSQKEKAKVDNKDVEAIKDFKQIDKLFQEAVQEENTNRQNDKNKSFEAAKKAAIDDLKTYVTTYSGKENAAKIRDSECELFDLDTDAKVRDPTQFKGSTDGIIDSTDISNQIKKIEEDTQVKDPHKVLQRNIGFKIGFKINFEG